MYAIGEAMQWLGFGLAGLGIAITVVAIIVKLVLLTRYRAIESRLAMLPFRGHLIAIVGAQVVVLGLILMGRLPWPYLILILVFGLPALIALRVRVEFPAPSSSDPHLHRDRS